MRSAKPESQSPKVEVRSEDVEGARSGLLTRAGLAAALRVSVRTVDRMVAFEEIPCVRLRAVVRFYLPDVVECLRNGERKWGRKAGRKAVVEREERRASEREEGLTAESTRNTGGGDLPRNMWNTRMRARQSAGGENR
jgi:hypothetical protein